MATKPPIPSPDLVKQLAQKAVATGVTRVIATLVDPAGSAKRVVDDVRDLPRKAAGFPLKVALEVVTVTEKVRGLIPGGRASDVADKVAGAAEKVADKAEEASKSGASGWDDAAPKTEAKPAAKAKAAPKAAPKPDPAAYSPPVMHEKAAVNPVETAAEKAAEPAAPTLVTPAPSPAAKPAPAKAAPVKATAPSPIGDAAATLSDAVKESLLEAVPDVITDAATGSGAPASDDDSSATADDAADSASADESPVATVTAIHAGRDGHRDLNLPPEVAAAVDAAPDGASLTSKELPITGFDNLSLPQLRARLSKLDIVAVTQLRDHERSHADRAPIVTMLENRIAKLAEQG